MSNSVLSAVKAANQDFEWYPTTASMINAVVNALPKSIGSVMDIGAGDGRVLKAIEAKIEGHPKLYAIEKSSVLSGTWPESIIPVGTDFFEQNLACLEVDYIFCNPPYSEFENWATNIIEMGYARKAFLVIPKRWADSPVIAAALKKRGAKTRVIFKGDFADAERSARAVIEIVEVLYPESRRNSDPQDPFDVWFDENVSTFDEEKAVEQGTVDAELAKKHDMSTIQGMVDAFNEEYTRMQDNYKAIFKLDLQILKELGVHKEAVRQGLKMRMSGLKNKYWGLLFQRLTVVTSRLCAETKKKFLEKLTSRAGIAFTASNAYAVVIWAIKNANKYFDEQLIKLFKDISVQDGIKNYKSNQRVWAKDRWRFRDENATHYALDYRFVVEGYTAIKSREHHYNFEFPGGLHTRVHDLIADTVAVLNNLGYVTSSLSSLDREWKANEWQDFLDAKGNILVQIKAFMNGNVHYRFKPEAIQALNVEAGRLLGWIHTPADVIQELGYTAEEADKFFKSNQVLLPSNVKLLTAG